MQVEVHKASLPRTASGCPSLSLRVGTIDEVSTVDWTIFESQVADLFKLFGYDVQTDTRVQSAQTDLFAVSRNRFKPRLLVECKFHNNPKRRVSIDEIENFAARVIRLRTEGKVDHGYLISNTGFSSHAKGSIFDSAARRFVFLCTYQELFHYLMDSDFYLQEYVRKYEESGDAGRFVHLWAVDSFDLLGNLFENGPRKMHVAKQTVSNSQHRDQTYVFVPLTVCQSSIVKLREYRTPVTAETHWGSTCVFRIDESLNDTLMHARNAVSSTFGLGEQHAAYELSDRLPAWHSSHGRPSSKWQWLLEDGALHVGKSSVVLYSLESCCRRVRSYLKNPEQNLLILLGDFGSGKTTTLRYIMYKLAQRKIARPHDANVRVPLLISLRDYNKVVDFDALLVNFLNNEVGIDRVSLPVFSRMNELGHFILLFDGFDEMARLVTPIERRLTFNSICSRLPPRGKIVLSGRPTYFPDSAEMANVLATACYGMDQPMRAIDKGSLPAGVSIQCIQLMDSSKLEQYCKKALSVSTAGLNETINRLCSHDCLGDLAKRPVLMNLIVETIPELNAVADQEINLFTLYEIYTKKWIQREADKGFFRILIDPAQKYEFVALLALQMHSTNTPKIHYRDLDRRIQNHFHLKHADEIDHFSHDVRTCSFLSRDDDGYYQFAHRSFMEFFVGREFSRFENSVHKGPFDGLVTQTILGFCDKQRFPKCLKAVDELREMLSKLKEDLVNIQDFEGTACVRQLEDELRQVYSSQWPNYSEFFRYLTQAIRLRLLANDYPVGRFKTDQKDPVDLITEFADALVANGLPEILESAGIKVRISPVR